MHIEITFLVLTLAALATFAGAFIFAALTSNLTGSDVREPAPFVLRRAPTDEHADLDLPIQLPRLPSKPALLAYRVPAVGAPLVCTYIQAQRV